MHSLWTARIDQRGRESMTRLTVDQVLALAPALAAAKAGQGSRADRKWQSLGHTQLTLWGLCEGSGKEMLRRAAALKKRDLKRWAAETGLV
jgi:hypothetical protein